MHEIRVKKTEVKKVEYQILENLKPEVNKIFFIVTLVCNFVVIKTLHKDKKYNDKFKKPHSFAIKKIRAFSYQQPLTPSHPLFFSFLLFLFTFFLL